MTVTFSTNPFGPSFSETISVLGIHPTLGLDIRHAIDRQHCQLVAMTTGTPSHQLPQWKSRLRHAFLLSVDNTAVYTISDVHQSIYLARQAAQTSVFILFTKDEANNSLSAVGLTQLYVDQLRVMKAHIAHTVQVVVHKAITGPTFNRRSLQKQSDWPEWRDSEWVQLDNYSKQGIYGTPCTAPIDASIFFWVWLYSIKPHENNRKKVRGVCDGSMVLHMHPLPNRSNSASKFISKQHLVCSSGMPMSQTPLRKLIGQRKCNTYVVTVFSGNGGLTDILILPFLQMQLILPRITFKDIHNDH
jgi:hypothetical protein